MTYQLMNFDTVLAEFESVQKALLGGSIEKWSVTQSFCDLSLFGIQNIDSWIQARKAPLSRANVCKLLTAMQITTDHDFINKTMMLSLNDTLWVRPKGSKLSFADVNLYDNSFSESIAQIAFDGQVPAGFKMVKTSPEFTTDGDLPKRWKRENGKILLLKGSHKGVVATTLEPFSEYFCTQLLQALGVKNFVPYSLGYDGENIVSKCELFTSKEFGFMQQYKIVKTNNLEETVEVFEKIGALNQLREMLLFDAIVGNYDRHFGNFGVMFENKSRKIVGAAPIFDNGCALMSTIIDGCVTRPLSNNYLGGTKFGLSFEDAVKVAMTTELLTRLRDLRDFQFTQHPVVKLRQNRFTMINELIACRIQHFLNLF